MACGNHLQHAAGPFPFDAAQGDPIDAAQGDPRTARSQHPDELRERPVRKLLFGTQHTPNYDNGLFGAHGTAAVDLKARLSTVLLGLALIQLGLALWMYGRVPGWLLPGAGGCLYSG